MKIEKPVLEVEGQKYEIKTVKAGDWRKFFKFDGEKADLATYEYIDKHCEIIAEFYEGISAAELEEKLALEEVAAAYHGILKYLMGLLTAKLGNGEEKNGGNDERVVQP